MTSATKILSLSAQAEALATRTQATVCAAVERLEAGRAQFREDNWTRAGGGGGRSRVLRDGQVFESAGVNVAVVHGPLPREMAEIARGDDGRLEREGLHFRATGVSIVLHARNPMVPTAHANYRYFELARADGGEPISRWFGGGADLTPAYLFEETLATSTRSTKRPATGTTRATTAASRRAATSTSVCPTATSAEASAGSSSIDSKTAIRLSCWPSLPAAPRRSSRRTSQLLSAVRSCRSTPANSTGSGYAVAGMSSSTCCMTAAPTSVCGRAAGRRAS